MEEVMQFTQVINATPHPIDVYDGAGERIVLELPHNPEDPIATCGERTVRLSDAEVSGVNVAVYGSSYAGVTGLPEPREGVWYVVALVVAIAAPDRTDLLVCGPAVRDGKNRMIGCKGLSLPRHPVAALAEPRLFRTKEALTELYDEHIDWIYEQTGYRVPADWYTPNGLAGVLFAVGLISSDEIDLAKEAFGDDWIYHSGASEYPNGPAVEDAIELLSTTYRYELRDSAFSDCEVHWVMRPYGDTDPNLQGPVADGYIGRLELSSIEVIFPNGEHVSFEGQDAWRLMKAGQLVAFSENSSMTTG
jgi:hypothetical protein